MDEAAAQLGLLLRKAGATDKRLLEAFNAVPRAEFLPASQRYKAVQDEAIEIDQQQILMPPGLIGFILVQAALETHHKVLEIGTGTGYQAALMAQLCRRVYSLEWHRSLLRAAEKRLRKLEITNVTCMAGDGTQGWAGQAPFDRIVVNAALEQIPSDLTAQLKIGGCLLFPLIKGKNPKTGLSRQTLLKITRKQQGFDRQDLIGVRFKEMIQPDSF